MAVSKLSRRIGGLTAAIVLGIAGMGVLATPALADDTITGKIDLQVDGKDYTEGMVAQVGQTIKATQTSTAGSDATIEWTWFCGNERLGDEWGYGTSSSYIVTPDNIGCTPGTIHVGSSVNGVVFASEDVPITPVSVSSGPQYTDFKNNPSWVVLQGYDPATLTAGTVVVTNWGSTPIDGLSCSIAPAKGSTSHFVIVTKPKSSLAAGEATIVQILPAAGVAGTDTGTTISEVLTCTTSGTTKWATPTDATVRLVVYSKPFVDINAYELQVGTVLDDSTVTVFPAADSVTYEWYSQTADGKKTTLSDATSYTIATSDVGKTLRLTATATIPGFDPISDDKELGVVPPLAVTEDEYWYVPYGYSASDLKPEAAAVTFTNYGTTAITGIKITCDSESPALVCGSIPDVTEIGPGKSLPAITVTPQVGQNIASYYAMISLNNEDSSVSSYSFTSLTVGPAPFDWIQPVESTSTGNAGGGTNGGNDQNTSGGAAGGTASGNHAVATGGTSSHGSAGIALIGLGFIAVGALILKRRIA